MIQRWTFDGPPAYPYENGGYVTYADHVAAVAAARADEREKWEPMVQALTDELLAKPPNMSMGAQYLAGVVAGVKAAREAVERCRNGFILAIGASLEPPERYWIPKSDALAAIDGVRGES